jgi:MerR family transcriptional regulator, light-induced transcriptional regulator
MDIGSMPPSQQLAKQAGDLAGEALAHYDQAYPSSRGIDDLTWREKSLQDFRYHILYLAEAIGAQRPVLFTSYAIWVRDTLTGLGLPVEDIIASLRSVRVVVARAFPMLEQEVNSLIERGIVEIDKKFTLPEPTFLPQDGLLAGVADKYLKSILAGNRSEAARLVMDEYNQGISIKDIYLNVFQPVQQEIGRLWQANIVSIAQEHYCTASTQLIMSQFYPFFFNTPKNGKVMVATCVGGEMHEIGMRMVADIFEMYHWDTYYIGANTPTKSVVRTLIERKAHLLGISATMTYNVSEARRLIAVVRSHPECQDVKILVGGYPFKLAPDLWKEIGADGWGKDVEDAVAVANQLVKGSA